MKVLFSYPTPYFLAHGGAQVLTESIMKAVAGLGVEVEPERWWDEHQKGEILHYVTRPLSVNVGFAKEKGYKVMMTDLLDQTASRSRRQLFLQKIFTRFAQAVLPGGLTLRLSWDVFQKLDAMVFAVSHEWEVAKYLFNATPDRGYIIGHGLEEEDVREVSQPAPEGDYLVSVATITQRKNTLLLARSARAAQAPVIFLGKPYTQDDPYYKEFLGLVDNKYVRYPGFVTREEKYRLLREARGFVHLSQFESGCIAVYEAAAAGLPLLLSDLPWARHGYPGATRLEFVNLNSPAGIIEHLKMFYAKAHRQKEQTFPVLTWRQVGQKYIAIYEKILAEKR
jgi:glycosyltransferase involved in cell wall biosynthesis